LQARQWRENVLLAKDQALGISSVLFAKALARMAILNVLSAMVRVSLNAVHAMARVRYKLGLLPHNDLLINLSRFKLAISQSVYG